MGLSHEDMRTIANGMAGPLHEHVQKAVSPLLERIVELERQLAEVSTRGLRYDGVHQRAAEYRRGSVVTHDGAGWVALKDSPQGKPGASDDWQLLVKRGRDGKDAR